MYKRANLKTMHWNSGFQLIKKVLKEKEPHPNILFRLPWCVSRCGLLRIYYKTLWAYCTWSSQRSTTTDELFLSTVSMLWPDRPTLIRRSHHPSHFLLHHPSLHSAERLPRLWRPHRQLLQHLWNCDWRCSDCCRCYWSKCRLHVN